MDERACGTYLGITLVFQEALGEGGIFGLHGGRLFSKPFSFFLFFFSRSSRLSRFDLVLRYLSTGFGPTVRIYLT